MDEEFEELWKKLQNQLEKDFDGDLDIQGILFLVGVQELGKGRQNFTKDQKVELMHIAICTILTPFGYYRLTHSDQDGWPHFESLKPLPHLKAGEQLKLMKQGLLEYFGKVY